MNRREFLRHSGRAGLSLVALDLLNGCSPSPTPGATPSATPHPGYNYTLGPWTGDTMAPMHLIRDGFHADLPKPEKRVKLLILGAGLAGLSLGYLFKNEEMMILERESTPGGNAKMGNYKGIDYALGSAYMVDTDEPFGSFLREVGMTLKPMPHPGEAVWTPTGWMDLEHGPAGKTVERIKVAMKALLKSPHYPSIPIQKATAKALKLDQMSYHDYLQKDYPDYIPMADEYCWTALGGPCKRISAYIGVNGLSEIASPIYAFPGGNAALAQKLVQGIEGAGQGRVVTGQSVYRVDPGSDTVKVGFFATHGGDKPVPRCIEADQVVLAMPFYFASRLMPWADASATKVMRSLEYGSYLVANLCFDAPVFHKAYDHWAPGNNVWADFVDADYAAGNPVKDAAVLTVYAPFRNVMEGRALLMKGDGPALARRVVDEIQARVGFPKEQLKEVRLTRYGHQIFTSRVGVVRQMLDLPRSHGRVHLCHSDGQAAGSLEGALSEAFALAPKLKEEES